jgi:hypothetical protein
MQMLCERRAYLNDPHRLQRCDRIHDAEATIIDRFAERDTITFQTKGKCCVAMMVRSLGLEWATDGCRGGSRRTIARGLMYVIFLTRLRQQQRRRSRAKRRQIVQARLV